MLRESEVVMLILGVGVLFFIIVNASRLKNIYSWKLLIAGYCVLLSGWIFTVLEGFFAGHILNYLEHASYLVSSVVLLVWCCRFARKTVKESET
ncbi:MAG: hypothetical protein JXQ80_03355 [Bacteroidales bacterium]|nr:hypothetical protein [Bacteroidales bacterium]